MDARNVHLNTHLPSNCAARRKTLATRPSCGVIKLSAPSGGCAVPRLPLVVDHDRGRKQREIALQRSPVDQVGEKTVQLACRQKPAQIFVAEKLFVIRVLYFRRSPPKQPENPEHPEITVGRGQK